MTINLPISGIPVRVDFDPAPIRQRYAEERALRLHSETLEQFQGLSDVLDFEDTDRYAVPIDRDPVIEDVEVAILGGGFGGLLAGAYLSTDGVTDFRIIEQAGDFGGTWYWNRYPGVQCDVESYIYMPLLEETGYVPSKRYADGAEILEHARRIGRRFDLYRAALFQTTVTAAEWSEDLQRWEIRTNRGDVLRAHFLLRANGPLSKPQLPRVPGITDFQGRILHTSRWDYDYTGGGPGGKLEGLRDKRVAIVGTGATGIQAIPYLAQDAKELLVIQRTPSTMGVRDNRPTDPEWAKNLKPGWQTARHQNFNSILNGLPQSENLVGDVWTSILPNLTGQRLIDVPVVSLPLEDQIALSEIADMQMMQEMHERIDAAVDDPATAAALKPWYGIICKRPCFNDEYLDAFNRRSVTLVAAPTGIDAITPSGLVVGGTHYDVDCIVFATGFETGTSTAARYGYDIIGRDGVSLRTQFANGAQTLHGFFSHGFPNFIELGLSQNAYVINFTFMLDRKARHAARLVAHLCEHGVETIEPELAAQNSWVKKVRESGLARAQYLSTCTPGYYSGQGDVARGFFGDVYNTSEVEFWDFIERWWEAGTFDGMTLGRSTVEYNSMTPVPPWA